MSRRAPLDPSSPYLRRHAQDLVDWRAWGEEASQEAVALDRPIFLSIGFAACHWCAAMHRESFADPSVAALLNERFVPVLVDREARPDVDALYTRALLAIQGDAGWPASLFLHPDLRPLTGATYLPPEPSYGLPSFLDVLGRVDTLWRTQRGGLNAAGDLIRRAIQAAPEPARQSDPLAALIGAHDAACGGFGAGAKFPQPCENTLLLTVAAGGFEPARRAARRNLDEMGRRSLIDAVGGGFFRCCVDREWTRPRFEKLLADQVELIRLYARASTSFAGAGARGAEAARRDVAVVRETVRYLWRDLGHPEGGFCSGEAADDPGGEGAFYLWTASGLPMSRPLGSEIADLPGVSLGPEPSLPIILDAPLPRPVRERLDERRRERPRPERIDARVVAWNGAAVGALAEAGRLLGAVDWIDLAAATADLLLAARFEDGALPRLIGDRSPGFLIDHASVAEGLLALYQARPQEPRWLLAASELAEIAVARFRTADGLFADSAAPELPLRLRTVRDDAEPSPNGRMAEVLRQLSAYGAPGASSLLDDLLAAAEPELLGAPEATSTLHLVALARREAPALVIAGPPDHPVTLQMLRAWDRVWRPGGTVALATGEESLARFAALQLEPTEAPRALLRRAGVLHPAIHDVDALAAALSG